MVNLTIMVPSVYYGDHDFIVAHHYFNTTGGQAPRSLACSVLTSQLNCLLLYKLSRHDLTTLNLLPTALSVCVCARHVCTCICVRVCAHMCISHKICPSRITSYYNIGKAM